MSDIIVIGGGAAGLLAAGTAANAGARVTLLERNDKLGRKLAITGKGRCNLTNNVTLVNELVANVPTNGRFLFSAFSKFMPADTMELFESLGVPLKVERGGRVFPQSDNAYDIVDALNRFITRAGVKRVTARAKSLLIEDSRLCGVEDENGVHYNAGCVIICTGGVSYPQTGSTGDGYALARQAGHTVIAPKPSLVALECHEGWCANAMGLTLKNVAVRVENSRDYSVVYEDFGELLITHFGVSGPVILSASAHLKGMEKGKYILHVDLKPSLNPEQLDKRIIREVAAAPSKSIFNMLAALLPRSLVPVAAQLSGLNGALQANALTKQARGELVNLLKDLTLTITGFRPIEEAVVTSGGVCVKELDPRTMQSKLMPGVFFAGEVMDVDAYTGGFNLQTAFSTGFLAGIQAADYVITERNGQ